MALADVDVAVPDDFREGLQVLHDAHGEVVEVVADDGGNYIFVDLGDFSLAPLKPDYDQDRTRVYKRLHKRFPDAKNHHYGFVTSDVLKVDGRQPDNTQVNRDQGDPLRSEIDADRTLYWSRNMSDLTIEEPEHMQKVPMHVRGCLNHPWE